MNFYKTVDEMKTSLVRSDRRFCDHTNSMHFRLFGNTSTGFFVSSSLRFNSPLFGVPFCMRCALTSNSIVYLSSRKMCEVYHISNKHYSFCIIVCYFYLHSPHSIGQTVLQRCGNYIQRVEDHTPMSNGHCNKYVENGSAGMRVRCARPTEYRVTHRKHPENQSEQMENGEKHIDRIYFTDTSHLPCWFSKLRRRRRRYSTLRQANETVKVGNKNIIIFFSLSK